MSYSAHTTNLYPPDSWPDDHWEDPESLPTGWAIDTTGTAPDTSAAYVAEGDGYAIELTSDADGKAMVYKVFADLTTATVFECRFEIEVASTESSLVNIPFYLRDGARRYLVYWRSTGLGVESGAVLIPTSVSVGDWITVTLRRDGDWYYVWDGPNLVHVALYAGLQADAALDGEIRLGNASSAAKTSRIRRFSLRIGSVSSMPPAYAMAGTVHGR